MGELTYNPQAALQVWRSEGEVTAVTAAAPVRGRPLETVIFARAQEPVVCDFLARIAARAGPVDADLDAGAVERLAGAGLLVQEDAAPRLPRFRCDAADPPADLLPHPHPPPPAPDASLHVSEGLRYVDTMGAPDEGRAPKLVLLFRTRSQVNPFDAGRAWAFVDHPDLAVPGTVSVPDEERPLFRRLQPSAPAPADLDAGTRAALARAGVLVDPAEEARRRAAFDGTKAAAAAAFARDRRVVLPALLHPTQIAALRRYYRALVDEGFVAFGDHAPGRYVAHNEPLARFFHRRLSGLVSAIAGEPVRPSYVYFASYRPGARIARHKDRAQCAFTLSMLVDHTPEPSGPSPWPLWVDAAPDGSGGGVAASLGLGDGLFFRGIELRHWREPLPAGHTSTSLLFHYVPEAFTGPLD